MKNISLSMYSANIKIVICKNQLYKLSNLSAKKCGITKIIFSFIHKILCFTIFY